MTNPNRVRSVKEMTSSGRVGKIHPLPESERPSFYPPARRKSSTLAPAPELSAADARIIYFDQRRAAELLENLTSSASVRAELSNIAENACAENRRATLAQLITSISGLPVGDLIDLHLLGRKYWQTSWSRLHPDQVVAAKGVVSSAKDIQPSSLRLEVGATMVRVFVERDRFLHLNQSYLSNLPITVIGTVRSIPRIEMCAAAIGTPLTTSTDTEATLRS